MVYEPNASASNADAPGEIDRLLTKAVEHLHYADGAYWEGDEQDNVALHIGYAQAAATTALALQAIQGGAST